MKLGIIGPSENEIAPFIKCILQVNRVSIAMLNFYEGKYNNINIVALYSGICKVNAAIATQILIDKFAVSHIIVVGVAGGIEKSLKIGDTVVGTEIAYHDVEDRILTEHHPWMENNYFKCDNLLLEHCENVLKKNNIKQAVYFGKIVTGEGFITQNGRKEIISKYNPLCVDMETASIAHVCYANKIPFLAIRSISDTEEKCGIKAFKENCVDASNNSIKILKIFLDGLS
ncbi:MAG: 5'-methylthioadenosine/adenosylhomocysteine nucleosidase [Peptococcaceae bacterium]